MAETRPVVRRLRARLYAFNSTGDAGEILGDEVRRDLSTAMTGRLDQVDMTALEIVAWLYWYRSQAGTGETAAADRAAAVPLFELMYVSDPEAVPGALQLELRERRASKHREFQADSPFSRPAIDVQATMRRSGELFQRYHLTGDPALLDDSISGFRSLIEVLSPGHVLRPLVEITLGLALQSLWDRSDSPDALSEGVTSLRAGLAAIPPAHEMRPAAMASLGAMLAAQYLEREDPALMTEAMELMEQAVAAAPPSHPMHATILSARDTMRTAHPATLNDPGGVDQAIAAARARLAAASPGDPARPEALAQLGFALSARFEMTGLTESLDETVELLREVVTAAPPDDPHLAALRGMLGAALSQLAARHGDIALSDEAIGLLREVLADTGQHGARVAAAFRGNLAAALWMRYGASGDPGVLDEAIDEGRQALQSIPAESPLRASLSQNLASALRDLHRRTGDLGALDEALALTRQAERTAPRPHAAHRAAMNNLSIGLILKARRTNDPAVRDEAVAWARKALAEIPADHPDRIGSVVTLAQSLEEAADDVASALPEAIDLLREAAHRTAVRPRRPNDLQFVVNALGMAMLRQARRSPELSTVDEAIGWLRRVTAQPSADPAQSNCRALLGKLLQLRFELAQDRAAMAEALSAFADAAGPDTSPIRRVIDNMEIGRTAAALYDWARATEGFRDAVAELPRIAPRSLERDDQEFNLTQLSGLAADAAACALNAKNTSLAAELLEQGRGVLTAQILEMRGDLDRLGDRDPVRAARLAAIRDQLDALGRPEPASAPASSGTEMASRRAGRRRKLAAEWDELTAGIRDRDSGIRPLSPAELTELAGDGPIVALNVSRYRSDAVLLTDSGIDVVELGKDGQLRAELHQRVGRFTAAAGHFRDQDADVRRQARSVLADTQGWLWDRVAARVLDRLGFLVPPPGPGSPPRIWWCAGGPLSLLPLHAAGRDGVAVIDSVVSSYTPSVRALRHARRRAGRLDLDAEMLVVAMSQTPGETSLPGADAERKWLRDNFRTHILFNDRATRDRILDALPRYPVAHFACHCVADISHPSASSLLCHDHEARPLTVADLSRLDLPEAGLAYCSVCSTVQTSLELADEAVHITGALQLAGYPQVIGSLWKVGDEVSVELAQQVYAVLGQEGAGGRSAAYALHEGMKAVRQKRADAADWAPYLHAGS